MWFSICYELHIKVTWQGFLIHLLSQQEIFFLAGKYWFTQTKAPNIACFAFMVN